MCASNSRAVLLVPQYFAARHIAYDVVRVVVVVAYDAEDVVAAVWRLMILWHYHPWKTLGRTLPEVVRNGAQQFVVPVKRDDDVNVLPVPGDASSRLWTFPLLHASLVAVAWN